MSHKLKIEAFSFEQIPHAARQARPIDLFRLLFGGCNTFSTSVLGSFPVLVGLSFWDGVWAILLGVTAGTCLLSPMSLFGPRNGTNDPVSSGAHFGIHGRLVGSFLALLTSVAFFSLAVWSSGDALVGGAHELLQLPVNALTLGLAYAFFALLVLGVCIYGFQLMLWANKVAVWTASLLFAVAIFAFAGAFDPNFRGSVHQGLPGYWAAFLAAVTVAASNPLSFAATLGDWGRYISENTPRHRMMLAVFLAQAATLLPFLFGLATATVIATQAPQYIESSDYIGGLLAVSPRWFLLPVCLIAIIGGISTGSTALYGSGLDIASILSKYFDRTRATLAVGVVAIAFIFVGRFALNLVESVSTLAALIGAVSCPWLAVMVIGYVTRRGHYLPADLQVFNQGLRGGHYWFNSGWNCRALGAWLPGAGVGLMCANVPGQFVGPLSGLLGGIDVSAPASLTTACILYLGFLWAFPEPDAVYGPRGRWLVPGRSPGIGTSASGRSGMPGHVRVDGTQR